MRPQALNTLPRTLEVGTPGAGLRPACPPPRGLRGPCTSTSSRSVGPRCSCRNGKSWLVRDTHTSTATVPEPSHPCSSAAQMHKPQDVDGTGHNGEDAYQVTRHTPQSCASSKTNTGQNDLTGPPVPDCSEHLLVSVLHSTLFWNEGPLHTCPYCLRGLELFLPRVKHCQGSGSPSRLLRPAMLCVHL